MVQLLLLLLTTLCTCASSNTIRKGRVEYTSPDEFGNDRCTAIAVGKAATADGSTMTTYNADCAECDWRVNKVEAQDWPEGSMRPIYLLSGAYPRQVRSDRGYTWSPENLENMPQKADWEKMKGEIIGHIPQIAHTYAILEGLYGIMNEFQVAIGESTCASKLFAAPKGPTGKGKALLEASELSQLGLERGSTARKAIQVMGDLAVKYGFYSAEWDPNSHGKAFPMGEGGEALTVVDPLEAWIFHIIPDDTGTSAVWVAQRVPDDHIAAVANMFIIRDVIKDSPDFMYSDNLWSVAEKMKWWSPKTGTPLNFLKTYAPQRYHPSYVNLRIWRVFTLASPDCGVPPVSTPFGDDYPFSMKVPQDNLLTLQNMIDMQGDHYEGTSYSTAQGLAGGPYGDPNRFDISGNGNMTARDALEGEFPRAISLFRTSQSYIIQARQSTPHVLAMAWFGQYAPDSTTYIPLYVAATTLPKSWTCGAMHRYNSDCAWWNFAAVGNYAARFYSFSMAPEGIIRTMQKALDKKLSKRVKDIEKEVLALLSYSDIAGEEGAHSESGSRSGSGSGAKSSTTSTTTSSTTSRRLSASTEVMKIVVELLTTFCTTEGDAVSAAWRDLLPRVITTYRDGMVIGDTDKAVFTIQKMFYPRWWLEAVGYFNNKGNSNGILFAANPTSYSYTSSLPFLVMFISSLCGVLGFLMGRRSMQISRKEYLRVDDCPIPIPMATASIQLNSSNRIQGISEIAARSLNRVYQS